MDVSRYAELFLTESREHLSAINHALLDMERTAGAAEPVAALFRAVHTVKGMSATMGYAAVAELSHEMESVLDHVRRGSQRVTPELMDALFRAADALETAIEGAVAGRADAAAAREAIGRIRAVAGGAGTGAGAPDDGARGADGESAGDWTAPIPGGNGALVRVRLSEQTPLRGVRAFMLLQRARTLGTVTGIAPSVEDITGERFGHDFAFRLVTSHAGAEIEEALRTVGDVDRVEITGTLAAGGAAAAAPGVGSAAPGGAAPGGAAGAPAAVESALRQQRHVRIDLRRLDNLMNLIGELVITRGRLAQLAAVIGDPALDEAVTQTSRLVADLQDEIMTSRMVPVWQVFDRFPRLVRDAARALGKQIDFTVEGKEIELDRSMLDEIGEPIVHLLRNAVDHGIESPAVRAARGKPAAGRLSLSAVRDRSAVVIRVSDDGRGIDRERVLERARSLGLVEDTRSALSDDELVRLISRPGFSTAEKVTDISGRGVGIDAVQARVRALGGAVDIRSLPEQGTTVSIRLPLTLAIVRALLARVNGEVYAIPMTHVNEMMELDTGAVRTLRGREVVAMRDDVLPVLHLRELVRLPRRADGLQQVVVLEVADRRAGLVVDELAGQQEIVVKQYDAVRDAPALFSGATILGDGAPALIVDVSSLL